MERKFKGEWEEKRREKGEEEGGGKGGAVGRKNRWRTGSESTKN